MKTKLAHGLTLLGAVLALTSCGGNPGVDRSFKTEATSINLSYHSLNLFVGDSVKLDVSFKPAKAHDSKFVISTSNDKVARVSSDGTVTAAGEGSCTVKVAYKDNEEINEVIPVRVTPSVGTGKALQDGLNKQLNYQNQLYPNGVNKFKAKERRLDSTEVNGKLRSYMIEESELIGSISDGFFSVGGEDEEVRYFDGSVINTPYKWIFYCDSDYYTHLYHEQNNQKNVLNVPTQSFAGQGRIEAIYTILDAIFTSGSAILKNQYEDVLSTKSLTSYQTDKRYIKEGGVSGKMTTYKLASAGNSTADYDDEDYFDIPYGTKYRVDFWEKMIWDNGIMRTMDVYQTMEYDYNGDHYLKTIQIQYTYYVEDEVEIVLPNNKEYNVVADLFDL